MANLCFVETDAQMRAPGAQTMIELLPDTLSSLDELVYCISGAIA